MYVDKKLASVTAVQALSRLNRSANSLNKRTEDLFVLDFFNTVNDIKTAFDPFFTVTSLSEATDVNVLHDLKSSLDDTGIYQWDEVVGFTSGYFDGKLKEELEPLTDIAAARFNTEFELDHTDKVDIKIKVKQFIKVYAQVASLLPYEVLDWETLFWFLKHLVRKLSVRDPVEDDLDELLQSVDLSSYGLERTKLKQNIELDYSEAEVNPQNSSARGYRGQVSDVDPLDEIIASFNERWFQGWGATPQEQRVKFINIIDSVTKHPDFKSKFEDNPDPHNRNIAFEKILKDVMLKRRKDELEPYKLYAADEGFSASWLQSIRQYIEQRSS